MGGVVSNIEDVCTSMMKYIVLNRSPENHVKTKNRLKPFTLLVFMFENIWGRARVASIDIEMYPMNGPNNGMLNV